MTTLATLVVRITANTTDYTTKMKSVQEIGKKMSDLGGKMSKMVTLPLVALGAASIYAASNLEESMSKVQVVFGDSAKSVEDFASSAAKNLGMSKQAALEASGTFGNLFVTMGLGKQPAADMSTGLVELAADLASFNNLNPEDVLTKLRSGLVGEVEPLRTLGVNLTAATTQAKAMEMGLADASGELSQSAMVQARYALILEQTTTAQGDFARTSGGLANKLRIAKAEMVDAAAALGEKLLPYATKAVTFITNLVTAFTNLPKPVQDTIVVVAALAAATGPLLSVFGKLIQAGPALLGFFTKLVPLIAANIAVLGPLALAIGAVVAVVASYNELNKKADEGIEEVQTAWGDYFDQQISQGKTATEVAEAYSRKTAEVNKVFNDQDDILDKVAVSWIKLTKDESKFLGDQAGLKKALLETAKSADEYWRATIRAAGGNADLVDQNNIFVKAMKAQAEADYAAAHGLEAVSDAAGALNDTLPDMTYYIDSNTESYWGFHEVTVGVVADLEAIQDEGFTTADAWAEYQKSMADTEKEADKLQNTLRTDLVSALHAVQDAQENWMTGAGSDVAGKLKDWLGTGKRYRDAIAAIDEVYGTSLTNQQEYQDAVAKLQAAYATTGDLDVFKNGLKDLRDEFMPTDDAVVEAKKKVEDLQDQLDTLGNTEIFVPVTIDVGAINIAPEVLAALHNVTAAGKAAETTTVTPTGGGHYTDPGTGSGYAKGGSGVVPPGFPNDSFIVGMTSGESFTITPPSVTGDTTTINVPITIYGPADPKEVETAARDGVLAAQRAVGKR